MRPTKKWDLDTWPLFSYHLSGRESLTALRSGASGLNPATGTTPQGKEIVMKKMIVLALVLFFALPAIAFAQSGYWFDSRGNSGFYTPPPQQQYNNPYQHQLPQLDTRGPDWGNAYLQGQAARRQELEMRLMEQELRERQRMMQEREK
jgi:hypothetical protein